MKNYDVIVIGAGAAGLGNSGVAHSIGLKTLLIEKDPKHFGGDCTNYGCVPSKALIHIAHQFYAARKAERFGLQCQGQADMKKVLAYIHEKQSMIRNEEDAQALRQQGHEVMIGEAKFVDRQTIEAGGKKMQAKIFLLCTGSSPRMLEIPGMNKNTIYTNETIFFDCDQLPQHFLVIGGGPIGCELGQAFQRLGSAVTIVNRGDRLLQKEPENVSQILENQFRQEGIDVTNTAEVIAFDHKTAAIRYASGREKTIACDAALVAVGRVVNSDGLGLNHAGIELTEKGKIKVDKYLRTTNRRVYAIGDAAGSYMFSHGAEKMVRQLWRNLLIPFSKKKNTTHDLSWVTFTEPQVAHFGWSQDRLDRENIRYYRQDQNFSEDDRAIIEDYPYGQMSLWMTAGKNVGKRTLLSGSMIAPLAGELIQEMELAKHARIPIRKITSRVYPYPVATRINQKTLRGPIMASYTNLKKKMARSAFRLFH